MQMKWIKKIIKWQKEDELKKIKLKIEDKKLKSNKSFIREIERNKRFISKFSDPYSERIGYNNVLEDFSNFNSSFSLFNISICCLKFLFNIIFSFSSLFL